MSNPDQLCAPQILLTLLLWVPPAVSQGFHLYGQRNWRSQQGATDPHPSTNQQGATDPHPATNQQGATDPHPATNQQGATDPHPATNQQGATDPHPATNQQGATDPHPATNQQGATDPHPATNQQGATDPHPATNQQGCWFLSTVCSPGLSGGFLPPDVSQTLTPQSGLEESRRPRPPRTSDPSL
ncbi:unnamed protein product [Arctogadus glacialis]